MTRRLTLPILASLLLAAHAARPEAWGAVLAALVLIPLMLSRQSWVRLVMPWLLGAASLEWARSLITIAQTRLAEDRPWLRMAAILGAVLLLTALSGLTFLGAKARARWNQHSEHASASAAAFLLTLTLLGIIQTLVPRPMILLERFLLGGGWLEALMLSVYAALLIPRVLDPARRPHTRLLVWSLFSLVFFTQLFLGLAGFDRFLMSGRLHLPVPAVVLAGPLYRGEGLFMPILFTVTLLVVGPAWCSWLCYLGACDAQMARLRPRPAPLPAWAARVRVLILILVVVFALGLRVLGASTFTAATAGLLFGLAGVFLMVTFSRRLGVMTHCVIWCPLGLVANLGSRLSIFRLKIADGCDQCGRCRLTCRYNALTTENIARRHIGLSCSLCGDCLSSCPSQQIQWALSPRAQTLYWILVVTLVAVFLGVARI
jgi:ferredoxin